MMLNFLKDLFLKIFKYFNYRPIKLHLYDEMMRVEHVKTMVSKMKSPDLPTELLKNCKVSSKNLVNKSKNWKLLLNKVKLHAHKKHNFNNKLMKNKKINYIKINIFPDGGISRIRVLGRPE